MRIAQLAPLVESVPPRGYGGSEQVVSLLTEELVKRGHEVTLFASADSVTGAKLVACSQSGLRRGGVVPTRWPAYDIKALLTLESMQGDFDIVHNHMGYQALPFLRNLSCPSVTTNHNLVRDYCRDVYLRCRELPYVAISESYRKENYPKKLNYQATIYNGIDIGGYEYLEDAKRTYLLFLGRLCAAKGTAEAITMALALGLPIKLAGKIDKNDQEYFDRRIGPLLNKSGVEYVGEVTGMQKVKLYSNAIATLSPVQFDEPFGLVLAESLASGTPVAAFRRGAIPEVISDGETGIIGDNVEDLLARFGEILKISPATCRKRAQQCFSKERMADQYEALFERLYSSSSKGQVRC